MTGCDKKFELIFRCMKQGVDATIQVLQSDADSKDPINVVQISVFFLNRLNTNSL